MKGVGEVGGSPVTVEKTKLSGPGTWQDLDFLVSDYIPSIFRNNK